MSAWPFGDLPMFGFDFIMADPPTEFRVYSEAGQAKSPQAQYETMTIPEICALPVGHLAAKNCILFLWTCWPLILGGPNPQQAGPAKAADSPAGRIMDAWGFRFSTGGAWIKRTRTGKLNFGTGYRVRSSCEPWLIGVNGDPEAAGASTSRNVIEGLAREHSRKPDEAYKWAERYMPDARRLDLFSRQSRPGWTTWGRESTKFDERPCEVTTPLI
jgi:N6-adenosine-specific RNA methylase IME4